MSTLIHLILRSSLIAGLGTWGAILLLLFAVVLERPALSALARATVHISNRVFHSDGGEQLVFGRVVEPVATVSGESARSSPPPRVAAPLRAGAQLRFVHQPEPGLVSVVIPSYNRARIIGLAIESALGQTYPKVQVVVADDGSVDDTAARVASYGPRVTYIRQENAGVSAARNFGIRHARGELIAFLDSDDAWQPWKIKAQVAALRQYPDSVLAWTDMAAVDEAGHVLEERHLHTMYAAYRKIDVDGVLPCVETLGELSSEVPDAFLASAVRKGDLYDAILLGNLLHTSTVLARRSALERVGGFDETFARAGEDYELYVRLCSAGPVVLLDAPSTLYRVGAQDQLTRPSMLLEIARNNLRAIEKWMPQDREGLSLPVSMIRRRYSEAFAWAGETELEAGHRVAAARRLSRSLALRPRLDRRTALLLRCALPEPVVNRLRAVRRLVFHQSDDDRPFTST